MPGSPWQKRLSEKEHGEDKEAGCQNVFEKTQAERMNRLAADSEEQNGDGPAESRAHGENLTQKRRGLNRMKKFSHVG
jgi:hypothetical protein